MRMEKLTACSLKKSSMSNLERQRIIDKIHQNATKYFTNAYMDAQTLSGLLCMDSSLFEARPGIAILVYPDGKVWRMVCFADSIASLEGIEFPSAGVGSATVLFEVIGSEETLSQIRAALDHGNSGLKRYKGLCKMTCRLQKTAPIQLVEQVEPAGMCDVVAIETLLETTFDRNVSHIPGKAEIRTYLEQHTVRVIREQKPGGKLKAFLMLEKTGRKACYIFQLAVAPEYRRQGLAGQLLTAAFAEEEPGMNYFLWVEEDNDSAISFYETLGFLRATQRIEIYKMDLT